MSPAGCSHVNGFKVDNWKQNLRVIYQCFVWSGSAETRKRKVNKIHQSPVVHCIGPSFPMPSPQTQTCNSRDLFSLKDMNPRPSLCVHASGCIGWPAQTPYALLSWGWTWGSGDASVFLDDLGEFNCHAFMQDLIFAFLMFTRPRNHWLPNARIEVSVSQLSRNLSVEQVMFTASIFNNFIIMSTICEPLVLLNRIVSVNRLNRCSEPHWIIFEPFFFFKHSTELNNVFFF